MYVTVDEVRHTIGVESADNKIDDSVITDAIKWSQDQVDNYIGTTYYPVEDSGTASSSTATTLVDSTKSWTEDSQIGYSVYIYDGTGSGQIREITDNDSTSLTVAEWDTNPDSTSKYYISYLNKVTETRTGQYRNFMFTMNMPVVQVDSLKINDIDINLDNIYVNQDTGKITLGSGASVHSFYPYNTYERQNVSITYHYGVLAENKRGSLQIPYSIKRFTAVIAGLKALAYQMGGTFDDLSTFNLPNFSGSIGQAYVNIKGTVDVLNKEFEQLKKEVVGRYYYIG